MGPASNTRCGPFCLSNASKYLRTQKVRNCKSPQQTPPIDSSWEGALAQSRIRTRTPNREAQMPLSTRSQASLPYRGSHILDISAWHIPNVLILAAANDCCNQAIPPIENWPNPAPVCTFPFFRLRMSPLFPQFHREG